MGANSLVENTMKQTMAWKHLTSRNKPLKVRIRMEVGVVASTKEAGVQIPWETIINCNFLQVVFIL